MFFSKSLVNIQRFLGLNTQQVRVFKDCVYKI
jgi:hypothetical protein